MEVQAIDPLHDCGNAANLEYRTIRFFAEEKISFVLSSRLAAFPQMCKGSIVPFNKSFTEMY